VVPPPPEAVATSTPQPAGSRNTSESPQMSCQAPPEYSPQ